MEPQFIFSNVAKPKTSPIMDVGRQAYEVVHAWQLKRHASVALKEGPEGVFLTEHDPVYTCGRSTKKKERPRSNAIPVVDIERGGGLTYHGPGQIVGYPILNLALRRLSIPQYLRKLEQLLIEVLAEVGVEAHYKEEYRAGLWVKGQGLALPDRAALAAGDAESEDKKIASIGIAVKRWVTFHGFALNVDCDLTPFRTVQPCGLAGDRITSLKELGVMVDKTELKNSMQEKILKIFF